MTRRQSYLRSLARYHLVREIRLRTVDGKNLLDIEFERNEDLVGVLKSVTPQEVVINPRSAAAGSTGLVPARNAVSEHVRKRLFPSGLIPVTIQGENYFLNGNYWANTDLLKSLNLLH